MSDSGEGRWTIRAAIDEALARWPNDAGSIAEKAGLLQRQGQLEAAGTLLKPLRMRSEPFVYRRYLDYGVFEGLRQLHVKVRDEAQRRAAGRPERANDVKLSRGGIREIEFIVQLLLVVRGGQFPEIRTRSTLKALDKLAAGESLELGRHRGP